MLWVAGFLTGAIFSAIVCSVTFRGLHDDTERATLVRYVWVDPETLKEWTWRRTLDLFSRLVASRDLNGDPDDDPDDDEPDDAPVAIEPERVDAFAPTPLKKAA